MAMEDLKDDFGGWLDSQINELDAIISDIKKGGDWVTPIKHFEQRKLALSLARSEFWDVLAR